MTSRAAATSAMVGSRTPDNGSIAGNSGAITADTLVCSVAFGVTPVPLGGSVRSPDRVCPNLSPFTIVTSIAIAALSQKRQLYVHSDGQICSTCDLQTRLRNDSCGGLVEPPRSRGVTFGPRGQCRHWRHITFR